MRKSDRMRCVKWNFRPIYYRMEMVKIYIKQAKLDKAILKIVNLSNFAYNFKNIN